jgi:hypothetical protein
MGASGAHSWSNLHPNGDYMSTFKNQLLAQDPNWAGAISYEMLYDARSPHAGLFDNNSNLTQLGARHIDDFRN